MQKAIQDIERKKHLLITKKTCCKNKSISQAFTELLRITKPGGIISWNIADGYEVNVFIFCTCFYVKDIIINKKSVYHK